MPGMMMCTYKPGTWEEENEALQGYIACFRLTQRMEMEVKLCALTLWQSTGVGKEKASVCYG